jgi:hypothetical protein
MPLLATIPHTPRTATAGSDASESIPPDLASFLRDTPAHPTLCRSLPPAPHAAALSQAALALAAIATLDLAAALLAGPSHLPVNSSSTIHVIGRRGVLHLPAKPATRAISLGYGRLSQRNSAIPDLRPGSVRLIPAHREVVLAELDGWDALAVEIAL